MERSIIPSFLFFFFSLKGGDIDTGKPTKCTFKILEFFFHCEIQDMPELIFLFLHMFILHNENITNYVRIAA